MEAAASAMAPASQHMRALGVANEVRLARAELKRSIRAGERDTAEVVLTCPWMAETMSLGELLRSQKRWGSARAQKLLGSAGLRETKTLNALTQRQRMLLSDLLAGARGVNGPDDVSEPAARGRSTSTAPAEASEWGC
jgi:hypothetical protein